MRATAVRETASRQVGHSAYGRPGNGVRAVASGTNELLEGGSMLRSTRTWTVFFHGSRVSPCLVPRTPWFMGLMGSRQGIARPVNGSHADGALTFARTV